MIKSFLFSLLWGALFWLVVSFIFVLHWIQKSYKTTWKMALKIMFNKVKEDV